MFEAYHVAVRLRLVDHVSRGLVHLGHGFARAQGRAAALQRQLHQIRLTAMAGFGVGAAGLFGLWTLRGPYEAARNFNTEIARFNALGLGDRAREDALRFVSAMDTIGTSLQEKLELYRDAMTVFRGHRHHAEVVMEPLAQMRFAMQVLHGDAHAGNMDRQFMDLLRVMELRGGLVSDERALAEMNFAFQTLNTSGGRVNPQALLAFMQTSGAAGRTLAPESLYYAFEPIIQEMGGPRAGTAFMTLLNRLITGRFRGQGGRLAGEEMLRLGLLDRSRVEFNSQGRFMRYRPGGTALVGADLFAANPFEWYHQYMLPAQRAAGIDTDAEFLASNLLVGSRTGARLLDIWRVQEPIIRRGIEMARQAQTIEEAYYAAMDTERGLEVGTSKKFHDLMIRLGQAVLPMAVAGLEALIPMLESMEQWVTRNPALVRTLITAFAGLSAAMLFGGVVLMLTAAFQGLGIALKLLAIPLFTLVRFIPALVGGFVRLLLPAFVALAAAIGWPATLIIGISAALGALGVWLYNNVEPFRNAVDGFLGQLQRIWDWITLRALGQSPVRAVARAYGVIDAAGNITSHGQSLLQDWRARRGLVVSDRGQALADQWRAAQDGPSPWVRNPSAGAANDNGAVYLDGQRVGRVLSGHLARDMRGPAVGASGPDPRRAPAPVAAPYARN